MAIDQVISLGNNKNIVTLELAGEIIDLEYPSQVEPNTPFDISYGVKNISTSSYTFFGYLEDEVGIISGTEWQMDIGPNDTYYPPVLVHPGIDRSITLTLTLGHKEVHVSEFPWMLVVVGFAVTAVAITAYVVAKKPKPIVKVG